MKQCFVIILFIAVAETAWCQQNWDSIQVTSQQVSENIYMLQGAGGNIGILTGADGVLMIDDQFLQLGTKITKAIRALDEGPIRFTLNTHVHGDHSGSNEYFKKLGATVLAHGLVRERMIKQPRDADAWPVITFPNRMSLHLNGEDIELMHFEPGHTDGDVIVHFKNANVFHMGDLFVRYGYPYIDMGNGGSINGMIASLDQALNRMNDASLIIPGHGEVSKKADVETFRNRLADIRDKVAAALNAGTKAEDLAGLGITDEYDAEWGGSFIKGKDFVLIVAQGLKSK